VGKGARCAPAAHGSRPRCGADPARGRISRHCKFTHVRRCTADNDLGKYRGHCEGAPVAQSLLALRRDGENGHRTSRRHPAGIGTRRAIARPDHSQPLRGERPTALGRRVRGLFRLTIYNLGSFRCFHSSIVNRHLPLRFSCSPRPPPITIWGSTGGTARGHRHNPCFNLSAPYPNPRTPHKATPIVHEIGFTFAVATSFLLTRPAARRTNLPQGTRPSQT
jgi:hypothetical protein